MPRHYKRKKGRRTKRVRRRGRRRGRISRWPSNKIESAFRRSGTFRYVTKVRLDANGVANARYVWRANSPFDPDFALGGTSAYKWNTYRDLFASYVVYKSKCKVMQIGGDNPGNQADRPGVLTLFLSDADNTAFSWENFIAAGRGSYSITSGLPSATVKRKLSATYNIKKFYNIKDIKDNFQNYGAPTDGNPLRDSFFILQQAPLIDITDPWAVNCIVVIDYYVIFSDPRNILIQ